MRSSKREKCKIMRQAERNNGTSHQSVKELDSGLHAEGRKWWKSWKWSGRDFAGYNRCYICCSQPQLLITSSNSMPPHHMPAFCSCSFSAIWCCLQTSHTNKSDQGGGWSLVRFLLFRSLGEVDFRLHNLISRYEKQAYFRSGLGWWKRWWVCCKRKLLVHQSTIVNCGSLPARQQFQTIIPLCFPLFSSLDAITS